jgi:hypothetical protein
MRIGFGVRPGRSDLYGVIAVFRCNAGEGVNAQVKIDLATGVE